MSTLPHTAQAGGGGERLACRDAGAAACPPRVGPWGNISRTVAPRGAERCFVLLYRNFSHQAMPLCAQTVRRRINRAYGVID